jgi:DNA-binding transcriptional ArsR family regulator
MSEAAQSLDGVFRALSDSTRRRVLEQLSRGPASVSELAAPFDMALPSFVGHLRALEECGLVRSRKLGRVRTYRLVPTRLTVVEKWLVRQRNLWERRLDQLRSRARPRARASRRRAARAAGADRCAAPRIPAIEAP